jgi:hypothetical protein
MESTNPAAIEANLFGQTDTEFIIPIVGVVNIQGRIFEWKIFGSVAWKIDKKLVCHFIQIKITMMRNELKNTI